MAEDKKTVKVINQHGSFGGIFLVTYVGAAIYFVHTSMGFWGFVLALLKAAVWPAFVVYHVLVLLKV
jgi:hypothetical protein